ncbi:uncharacterized protein AFUA_7G05710 [Aspergillus fumigatus Af293]|uniref:Uncharacterized protein n=1 Tax=Aspergillus fumigatus (strain ATCC MYA-4609 / CBS 101355 / FGSC A1100 / Af293) TaxID=330879 RepID=Q4WGP0_ASPFU|nr:hypothetical protein AFUA_7G05710 [Aspergillus fumigatus Af293]EAL86901.1 hypothetical protein AFUA_7G05710 [Aspergillus fumigatus Af293]
MGLEADAASCLSPAGGTNIRRPLRAKDAALGLRNSEKAALEKSGDNYSDPSPEAQQKSSRNCIPNSLIQALPLARLILRPHFHLLFSSLLCRGLLIVS